MAVFHLKAGFGSRAGGQSARAKSDYIEREGRYEKNRRGTGAQRERKHAGVGARTTPERTGRRRTSTNAPTGRLYSEVQFALPKELNEDERREAASSFAERLTGGERLPYTLAIHRGGANGENPHAHLMFSERGNDGIERSGEQWFKRHNAKAPEKGGARKSRAAKAGDWLEKTRKAWEQEANRALERAGRVRAHRPPQPGRSAGRSTPGRRPGAGGGVEPGAERPSWPGAVQDEPGRGVGDGEAGGARRAEERGGPERAGRRQPESGAAKAGDRRGRGAAEGDL